MGSRFSLASGAVIAPVRLADADVTALLSDGDLVDVVGADEQTGRATVVASRVRVVAVPPAARDPASSAGGGLILVEVERSIATALAQASVASQLECRLAVTDALVTSRRFLAFPARRHRANQRSCTMKGFREFLLRGNLVELAVAVIMGTVFAAVVKAFTDMLHGRDRQVRRRARLQQRIGRSASASVPSCRRC